MTSTIVRVRLQPDELAALDQHRLSVDGAELNRSEFIRLLLRREHLRRTTGRSAVAPNDIASDFRTGRPKTAD